MKAFSNQGFRLREASLETRLAYTGFLILTALGLLTNLGFQVARIGLTLERIAIYYRGGELKEAMAFPKTFGQLLELTHFHTFTMAIIFLVLAHLLIATSIKPATKYTLIALAFASPLADLAGPWLIRYLSPEFALLQLLSWLLGWIGYGGMILIPLYEMWFAPNISLRGSNGT